MSTIRLRRLAALAAVAVVVMGLPRPAAATDARYLCLQGGPPLWLKDLDQAIAACTTVIATPGTSKERLGRAYGGRAMMFSAKKDWAAAASDGDHAVELAPDNVMFIINRGAALASLKRYDRAIADYSTAIRLEPRFAYSYFNRGAIYLEVGREDDALADFRTAVGIYPQFTQALSATCLVLAFKNQDLDDAQLMCSRALQFTRNDAAPFVSRAFLNLRLGKAGDALADAETALKLRPDNSDALVAAAAAEQALGRADAARDRLAKAEAKRAGITANYARRGFLRSS